MLLDSITVPSRTGFAARNEISSINTSSRSEEFVDTSPQFIVAGTRVEGSGKRRPGDDVSKTSLSSVLATEDDCAPLADMLLN